MNAKDVDALIYKLTWPSEFLADRKDAEAEYRVVVGVCHQAASVIAALMAELSAVSAALYVDDNTGAWSLPHNFDPSSLLAITATGSAT